jgi:hypothetical protein
MIVSSAGASTTPYTPPAPERVANALAAEFGGMVWIKDYRAICDGTPDDTIAMQNAWNYAVSIPAYSASPSSVNAPSVAQPCVDDLPLIPALVSEIQKRRLRIVQLKKEL